MNYNKRFFGLISLSLIAISIYSSCTKYLDARPDKSFIVPKSVGDIAATLNATMTAGYPASGAVASDYYYLTEASFNSLGSANLGKNYLWDQNTQSDLDLDYAQAYQRIFYSNVALDQIIKMDPSDPHYNEVYSQALFFRAYNFFEVAQIYGAPFFSPDQQYGIPLKRHSDINEKTVRSTVDQTYQQIVNDLLTSVEHLPAKTVSPELPTKAAGYAMLSRVYLSIGNYDKAAQCGEKALSLNSSLMDFATIDTLSNLSFKRYNKEVIFHVTMQPVMALNGSKACVDTNLYRSYEDGDLRRPLYFRKNTDGSYRFKGNYDGTANIFFCGLATDELYLTVAEANMRMGRKDLAAKNLNTLLISRYKTGEYVPVLSTTPNLLLIILKERYKELAFRGGLVWMDLRRLNADPGTARTLKRVLSNTVYELNPGDLRYTFLYPSSVITESGINQNPR